jgi:three-Cys-motif partner protein
MRVKHEFGGDWTEDKLIRLRKYLPAYLAIMQKNLRAQHFTTVYVDAFAGTGHRVESKPGAQAGEPLFPELAEADAQQFLKGSARIALEQNPGFDKYIFIESNPAHCAELEKLRDDFPEKADRIEIHHGVANAFLDGWCQRTDWRKHRAVVFLDPYGMQVDWVTVEAIAKTEAIDLWFLFALGSAFNRLLTTKKPPPEVWANALTRTFGTDAWKDAFYPKKQTLGLFDTIETQEKDADFDAIGRFFVDRLKTVFCKVAENPLPLRNSTNVPIYLLCFAANNPKGASTAVKIASHVLRRSPSP